MTSFGISGSAPSSVRWKRSDLVTLAENRVYVTTVATHPAWVGLRTFNIRGFYPNLNNHLINIPEGSLVYRPEHPLDWVDHPASLRIMEFLVLTPSMDGQVKVAAWPAKRLVFMVHPSWLPGLLSGERTEQDILTTLEASASV